jgi:TonB family protein
VITALPTLRFALLVGTLSLLTLTGCAGSSPTRHSVPPREVANWLHMERIRNCSRSLVPRHLDAPLNVRRIVLPEYPSEQLRQGIDGVVLVEFTIGTDGKVTAARSVRSPDDVLSVAALHAVRQWEFDPPTKDGRPRSFLAEVPLEFRLR